MKCDCVFVYSWLVTVLLTCSNSACVFACVCARVGEQCIIRCVVWLGFFLRRSCSLHIWHPVKYEMIVQASRDPKARKIDTCERVAERERWWQLLGTLEMKCRVNIITWRLGWRVWDRRVWTNEQSWQRLLPGATNTPHPHWGEEVELRRTIVAHVRANVRKCDCLCLSLSLPPASSSLSLSFCQCALASPAGVWQLNISLGNEALFRNHYKARKLVPRV